MKKVLWLLLLTVNTFAYQAKTPAEPVKIAEGSYSVTGRSPRDHKETTSLYDKWELIRNADGSLEYRTEKVPPPNQTAQPPKVKMGYVFSNDTLSRYYWEFASERGNAHFDCSISGNKLQFSIYDDKGHKRSQTKTAPNGPVIALSGEMYAAMNDMAFMNLSLVRAAGAKKSHSTVKAMIYQSDSVKEGLEIDEEDEQVEFLGEQIVEIQSRQIPVNVFALEDSKLYVTKNGVLVRLTNPDIKLELTSFKQSEPIVPELR